MSYCSAPTLPFLKYLDENRFLTLLTSFTFLVIGVFIYLLKCYTYFEKQQVPRAVRPTAPFGNIKEVVWKSTTLYEYVWRYYNKFKRKGCRFGGLYLFTRPAVIVVDKKVIERIGKDSDTKSLRIGDINGIKRSILESYQGAMVEDLKSIQDIHDFIFALSSDAFGVRGTPQTIRDHDTSNFCTYLTLAYPLLKRSSNHHKLLKDELNLRKDNDIKKVDVLQNLTDVSDEALNKLFVYFVNNINHSISIVTMCLYELSLNESIQEDLIGELRRFRKEFGELSVENIDELGYLEAVVQETLRKYPPVPVFVQKNRSELGLKLPDNGLVIVPTYGIHHDPQYYVNPEEFDTDRFLDNGPRGDTFYPFGFDSGKNIGFILTTFIVKVCLYATFSRFRVKMGVKTYKLEFDATRLGIYPKKPLPLKFEPCDL